MKNILKLCSLLAVLVLVYFLFVSSLPTTNSNNQPLVTSNDNVSDEDLIPNTPTSVNLSFVAVGDNLIHGAVYKAAATGNDSYDFTPFYEPVKAYIAGKDLAFINQETIVGGKAIGLSHYPLFNSPEEVIEAIDKVGFNLVNTATNHSLDKGEVGITNALNTFDLYPNLLVAGINRSMEEQDQLRYMEVKGVKVAFLAYTQHTNGITPKKDYLVNLIDEERIKKDVKNAQKICDIILVSMHWGTEYSNKANDYQIRYAKLLNELGVDIIIGTGPHVIQEIEYLENSAGKKTLVIYSLGNFLSAQDTLNTMVEGMVMCDLTYDLESKKLIFNETTFVPLVNYYNNRFSGYRVYPLIDYTDSISATHYLKITPEYVRNKTNEVITDEKIKILY